MDNPIFIPIRFAANGLKSVIQKVLQSGQDPEDMTWNLGTPQITMTPKEDGGLPPKGQDFNGVLYTLSDHAVQRQNGGQIVFSPDVVAEYGGYAAGSIVQSTDTLRHFRSLINNNTFNPNTQTISGRWEIYTGAGSVPTASSTTAGVMRVINDLTSSEVGSALSANMGRVLDRAINQLISQLDLKLNISSAFGFNQSYTNVTSSRLSGYSYTNITPKPILCIITIRDSGTISPVTVHVNNELITYLPDLAGSGSGYHQVTFIVPSNQTYSVNSFNNPISFWSELR